MYIDIAISLDGKDTESTVFGDQPDNCIGEKLTVPNPFLSNPHLDRYSLSMILSTLFTNIRNITHTHTHTHIDRYSLVWYFMKWEVYIYIYYYYLCRTGYSDWCFSVLPKAGNKKHLVLIEALVITEYRPGQGWCFMLANLMLKW